MKRFYCTVCKKIKRVRVYPASVADTQATSPQNRIGECKYHSLRAHENTRLKVAR